MTDTTGNDTKWHAFLEANVGKPKKNAHIIYEYLILC